MIEKLSGKGTTEKIFANMDKDASALEKTINQIPQSRLAGYFAQKNYQELDGTFLVRTGSVAEDDELLELELKDKTQEICTHAIERCGHLSKITIVVNRRLYIEKEAFFQCDRLQQVIIYCDESDWVYVDQQAATQCPLCQFVYRKKNSEENCRPHLIEETELLHNVRVDEAIDENKKLSSKAALFAFKATLSELKETFLPFEERDIKLYFSDDRSYYKNDDRKIRLVKENRSVASAVHDDRYDDDNHYQCIPGLDEGESRRIDNLVDLLNNAVSSRICSKDDGYNALFHEEATLIESYYYFLQLMQKNKEIIVKLKHAKSITYRKLKELQSGVREYFLINDEEAMYTAYHPLAKEIQINIENIAAIAVRGRYKEFCFSRMVQLFLAHGYYKMAAWDRIGYIDDKNQLPAEKLIRIISAKAMIIYKNEVIHDTIFDDGLFIAEAIGDYFGHPEILCGKLDEFSDTNSLNAYALIFERMNRYSSIVWTMICDYFLDGEEMPAKSDAEVVDLLRAYREFHPHCTLKQLLDVLPWVSGKCLIQAGFNADDFKQSESVPACSHFSDDTLEKLTVDDSVRYIHTRAYALCKNLKKLVIYNDSELVIEPLAFAQCGLEEIIVQGQGKLIIADFAFQNCEKLKRIAFENQSGHIAVLPKCSFIGCPDLLVEGYPIKEKRLLASKTLQLLPVRGLSLPDVNGSYNDFFYTGETIKSMQYYRTQEKTIVLSKPLYEIHPLAYCYSDKVREVVIRNRKIRIGSHAFYKLPNLKTICFECDAISENINPEAFREIGDFKVVLKQDMNSWSKESIELFYEEMHDAIAGKIGVQNSQKADFGNCQLFECDHLNWLCCNKIWQYENDWQSFLTLYFDENSREGMPFIVFADRKEMKADNGSKLEEHTDIIRKLCHVSLFKRDENKKKITAVLDKHQKQLLKSRISFETIEKLIGDLFEKNESGHSLLEQANDEKLKQRLHLLRKELSVYLYNNESLCSYDVSKKEHRIYLRNIWTKAFSADTLDIALCLHLMEYAMVYGMAAEKLSKLYESCDWESRKTVAVVEGCASAIALDYLYQKEEKETCELVNNWQNLGLFPYWPYALHGQLYYQCYEDRKQLRELLKDIIEKAAVKPQESIEMAMKLCCVEENIDSII